MGKLNEIAVSVSDAMLARIDEFASARGLDRAGVLHLALTELIAEQQAMDAFVQAGIDSAESEPMLSQAEVRAWVEERRRHRIAAE